MSSLPQQAAEQIDALIKLSGIVSRHARQVGADALLPRLLLLQELLMELRIGLQTHTPGAACDAPAADLQDILPDHDVPALLKRQAV